MHSLDPYTLKVNNGSRSKNVSDNYFILNKINGRDAYIVLKEFITSKLNHKSKYNSTSVYIFSDVVFDDDKRILYGWFKVGKYGSARDIIDVESGDVDFNKTEKNAEMIEHFFYFDIPLERNEGIVLFHAIGGGGIKTIFYDILKEYFRGKTGFIPNFMPMGFKKAFDEWKKADAKQIRLIAYNKSSDITDDIAGLGHVETSIILKPQRNQLLGALDEYLTPESEKYKVVSSLREHCEKIQIQVELGGKTKVINIGPGRKAEICSIEAPDDLKMVKGNPTFGAMRDWCEETAKDFSKQMYSV